MYKHVYDSPLICLDKIDSCLGKVEVGANVYRTLTKTNNITVCLLLIQIDNSFTTMMQEHFFAECSCSGNGTTVGIDHSVIR